LARPSHTVADMSSYVDPVDRPAPTSPKGAAARPL
jgi:hypothetical protein